MRHILFISAEFPPCGGGGVGRVSAITRHLAEVGHKVTVLTASENHYRVLDTSLVFEHPNLRVIRVESPAIKTWQWRIKKVLPFITFDDNYVLWRCFAIGKAKQLYRATPFDLVVSSYPCTSNHAVAYTIAKEFSLPWCADYRDPPWWMYSNTHKEQKKFHHFAKYSAHNIVTTDNAKQLLLQKLAISDQNISVVQNGCAQAAADIPLSVTEELELLHTGSFYEVGRDINDLIRAIDSFPSPITMRFIGDAPYPSTEKLLKQMMNPERIIFCDYMSTSAVLEVSAAAFALVVIQGPLFTNQIPGKVYEYLALQKPVLVITNQNSATYQVMQKEPNVIFAEYADDLSIKQGLLKVTQHQVVQVDRQRYTRNQMVQQFSLAMFSSAKH